MMEARLYVTTSWDDGHPLDLKVAELLAKYGLPGTFYVPLRNRRQVMSPLSLRRLSESFEIGGHTVSHCDLLTVPPVVSQNEIEHCKVAIEQLTAKPCRSFCFPLGRFRRRHLQQVRDAGFSLTRTVELMSLDAPRRSDGLWIMPTSIQALPTGCASYVKNSMKRFRPENFLRFLRVRNRNWPAMLEALLERAPQDGRVVHLWGHSWEIEEHSDWMNLERAFSLLAQYKSIATFVANGELPNRITAELAPGA